MVVCSCRDSKACLARRGVILASGLLASGLLAALGVEEVQAMPPAGTIRLYGVVTDFRSTHPDFNVTNPADMGHFSNIVGPNLGPGGKPVYVGDGRRIDVQWQDRDLNPIKPYGDPGLVGGHFDVDVFDVDGSTSEIYHEHQFDDKYNVTYVDVANDPKLLFDVVVGRAYPNDLRVTFSNVHNGGGGTFVFQAGGAPQTGLTSGGFTAIFRADQLSQLRVNFIALSAMRQTQPGNAQGDAIDRDDSLRIRMYDVTNNKMVYELIVYNHFKKGKKGAPPMPKITPRTGNDRCGVPFNDTVGVYGPTGTAGIAGAASFAQWFSMVPGTSISAPFAIDLKLAAGGVYEFLTDSFFPADDRLFGNEGAPHNNYFTYYLSTTFTYHQCTGQFFEFEGNDDAWVFIDGQLVIDLGGAATPERQYVRLDRMNLVDGQVYPLKLFYAHRRDDAISRFNIRTNLLLRSTTPLTSNPYD